jgi:hypothetical protein
LITGKYIIKSNGEILGETNNILTGSGINAINLFLTNSIPDWAGAIAIGAIYTSTASTDQRLAYETSRALVTSKTYLPSTKQIVVKATVDPLFIGSIYELGVVPQNNIDNAVRNNTVISNFDQLYSTGSLTWLVGPTVATASYGLANSNARVGTYGLTINTASVGYLSNLNINVSAYSNLSTPTDYVDLMYFVPTSATATTTPSLVFIFADSASNKWTSSSNTLSVGASGFYTASFSLANAPASAFSNVITSVTASFFGSPASSGSIVFDALRLRAGNLIGPDETLLSRSSATAAIATTTYGQPLEIEYYLTVT